MEKGKFIVVEGPNGAGKSSVIMALSERARLDSIPVIETREPTYSELGNFIRTSQSHYSKEVLACLVTANRYEHIEKVVQPALDSGHVVLCDRYFPSSLVYQIMDGLEYDFIQALNQKILVPHLTVILTAEESQLQARLRERSETTRFEQNQKLELKLYQDAYNNLYRQKWNIINLDSGKSSISEITERIFVEMDKLQSGDG